MSAPLKPCPFCGEAEHLYPAYRNMGAGAPYAIDCLGCGMDFVPRDGMDVIAMWNRRAADEPVGEPAEQVGSLIKSILALAPAAGLYIGIKVQPAKASLSLSDNAKPTKETEE